MANKIKYGLRNVYYAKVTATDETTGALTYATPVRLPGAVNLTMDAAGEESPFYADDVVYWQGAANNGYSGSLELALIPDAFRKDILGENEGTNGVLYEMADARMHEFALMFEFQGDESATRHCFYRCSASRPGVNGATQEASITPQTETFNLTAMARINDLAIKAKCPASATPYSTWFDAVPEFSPTRPQ